MSSFFFFVCGWQFLAWSKYLINASSVNLFVSSPQLDRKAGIASHTFLYPPERLASRGTENVVDKALPVAGSCIKSP